MKIQIDNETYLPTEILCLFLHVYLDIMPLDNIEPPIRLFLHLQSHSLNLYLSDSENEAFGEKAKSCDKWQDWSQRWMIKTKIKSSAIVHSSSPVYHHPYSTTQCWHNRAVSCGSQQTERLVQTQGRKDCNKYRQMLIENLIQSTRDRRFGQKYSNRTTNRNLQPTQNWRDFRCRMWKSLTGPAKPQR